LVNDVGEIFVDMSVVRIIRNGGSGVEFVHVWLAGVDWTGQCDGKLWQYCDDV
jgi:hypothetical protein